MVFSILSCGLPLEVSLQSIVYHIDGDERDELIRLTANQMKRDLVQWGHGSIDDEKVADDMARMTNGAIQLDLNSFVFERVNLSEPQQKRSSGKKKK